MAWKDSNPELLFRRVKFKGSEEQLPKVLALLDKENVSRKTLYLVLKYFEFTPDGERVLQIQFPDI